MPSEQLIIGDLETRFSQAFNRLAVAKRLHPDEIDAAMKRVYFTTLSDLPIGAIEAAADQIAQGVGPFPRAGEWRQAALICRDAREEAQWATKVFDRIECPICEDTGFAITRGPVSQSPWAHRAKTLEEQARMIEWARGCECRPTNTRYQWKRATAKRWQKSSRSGSPTTSAPKANTRHARSLEAGSE